MKKMSMILFVVALMVSFAACSGGKKEEQKATEPVEVKVEETQTQPVAAEVSPEDALKSFEEFSKKYVDVINQMKVGKTSIIQEYSKLSASYQEKVADMERYKVDFTPAQVKRYSKAQELISKALKSWEDKK